MTTLRVPDMHCEHCVQRITKALGALKLNFEVKLPERQVLVDANDAQLAQAIEALDDLGFEATKE